MVGGRGGPVSIKSGYGRREDATPASSIRNDHLVLKSVRGISLNPGLGDEERKVQYSNTPEKHATFKTRKISH